MKLLSFIQIGMCLLMQFKYYINKKKKKKKEAVNQNTFLRNESCCYIRFWAAVAINMGDSLDLIKEAYMNVCR